MFEHLDDPSAGEPSARQIAAVYARSSAIRRRRANTRFAALGLVLLVVGLLAGTLIPRSPTRLAVTNLALDDHELVVGLPVPAVHLINAVFPDADHGFAVTTGPRKVALVATSDAGTTWTVVDPDLPIASPWGLQLDFTDPVHGYLWGGGSSGPMWVTANGGHTWSKAPIGPVVFDVSAIGSNVWAASTCRISGAITDTGCPVTLDRSADGGRSWTVVSQVPTAPDSTSADHTVELARMTSTHAYVLSLVPNPSGGVSEQLDYTADGGQTWTARADPCNGSVFSYSAQLVGSGTDDLWLLCVGEPSAGQQPKALYRSFDGALTWALTSSAVGGVQDPGVVSTGTLPEGGYFENLNGAGTLVHGDIAVVGANRAWIFLDRGTVIQTTDGGHTWSSAQLPGFSPDGFGTVVFATPTHGWVDYPAEGIWQTTDAIRWKQLGT